MMQNKQSKFFSKKHSFIKVLAQINVLILIMSFTIISIMFVWNFRQQTKEIFLENSQSKINQTNVLIEYISDTVVNMSRQVFRNQKFNRLITTEFSNEMPRYEARTEAVKILEPQQQAFRYIDSLIFIGKDGFSVGAPIDKFLSVKENEFNDTTYTKMAWDSKSEYVWLAPRPHPVYSPEKPVISVVKSFQNFITLENSGTLIINIDPDIFSDAIANLRIGGSGFMLLADETGQVIAKPNLDELGISTSTLSTVIDKTLENALTADATSSSQLINFESNINGEFYFITYSRLEKTNWYTIAIVESSALTSGATELINLMLVVIIIALGLSTLISLKFSQWLFKPLIDLANTLNNYRSGDYDIRIDETYRYEFEVLRENFNTMADRISEDFKRISTYSESLEKSKSELNTLNLELEKRVSERTKELIETNQYLEETLAQNEETQSELMMTKNDLENSLIELQETQSRLIESQKNAALGQLLAGISHEINTPLGTALTTVTYMQTLQKRVQSMYVNKKLSQSEFESFMGDSIEMTEIINATLEKTIGILSRFKEISILQSEKDISKFYLRDRLKDITAIYLERHPLLKFEINVDENLRLAAPKGLLHEIFEILMDNSIKHGFGETWPDPAVITISAESDGYNLTIIYTDNGLGLEDHQKTRIFEPFYTTKFGSGGSGLGLHLLYNIVSTALQGKVDIIDIEEQGLSFRLTFPKLIS